MDMRKRRTILLYSCEQCGRSYSRSWVLKRHLLEQHDIQSPRSSSDSVSKTLRAKVPRKSEHQIRNEAIFDTFEMIRSIYRGPELSDQGQADFFQKWLIDFIPFPKVLISGFSCYFCPNCLTIEIPVPIKDLGVDLTCKGRHRCQGKNPESETDISTLISDQKPKFDELALQMLNLLHQKIDLWITGKKLIVTKQIPVPKSGDKNIIRKYIETTYNIPNKYHLVDVDFQRLPWMSKLLIDGKLEPTARQLREFCSYCYGTYAIFRIHFSGSIQYFLIFLTPAETSVSFLVVGYP